MVNSSLKRKYQIVVTFILICTLSLSIIAIYFQRINFWKSVEFEFSDVSQGLIAEIIQEFYVLNCKFPTNNTEIIEFINQSRGNSKVALLFQNSTINVIETNTKIQLIRDYGFTEVISIIGVKPSKYHQPKNLLFFDLEKALINQFEVKNIMKMEGKVISLTDYKGWYSLSKQLSINLKKFYGERNIICQEKPILETKSGEKLHSYYCNYNIKTDSLVIVPLHYLNLTFYNDLFINFKKTFKNSFGQSSSIEVVSIKVSLPLPADIVYCEN